MANLTFKQYTDAVVAALADLRVANGGVVKTLKNYAGEITIRPDGLFYFVERPTPMILVEVESADYVPYSHPYFTQTVTLNIYVVVQSLRSDEAAWEDMSALLDDLRALLLEKTCSLDIQELQLKSETKVDASPNYVFYLAQYTFINNRISAAGGA